MKRPVGANPLPAPAAIEIREAVASDAEGLAVLLGGAFPEMAWDADRARRDLLEAPDVAAVYVIEDGRGGLAATASVRYFDRFPGSGYVHWVGVAPDQRGRRLGTIVMARVLQRFTDDGKPFAILETDDIRLPALASYLGQGFIPIYTEPDHEERWSRVFEALAQSRRSGKGG